MKFKPVFNETPHVLAKNKKKNIHSFRMEKNRREKKTLRN